MAEEAKLQAKILRHLDDKKIYYVRVISASKAGAPDIVACIKGMFLAIEVKSSVGQQGALQRHNEKMIKKSGGRYLIIRPNDFKYLKSFIEDTLGDS